MVLVKFGSESTRRTLRKASLYDHSPLADLELVPVRLKVLLRSSNLLYTCPSYAYVSIHHRVARCSHHDGGPIAQPQGKRRLRVMKYSPSRQRNLIPTCGTLPASLFRQSVSLVVSAATTREAIGPAAIRQILLAGVFAGDLRLKFAQSPWKDWAHHIQYYRL
jgi:hypothetical protein